MRGYDEDLISSEKERGRKKDWVEASQTQHNLKEFGKVVSESLSQSCLSPDTVTEDLTLSSAIYRWCIIKLYT